MSHNHTKSDDEQLLTAIQGGVEGQNTDGDDENQQLDAAAAATNENVEVLPAENANATALVPLHKQFRVWFGGVAILGTIVALIVVLPGEGNQSIPTPAPSLSLIPSHLPSQQPSRSPSQQPSQQPSVSQQPTMLYQSELVALYDATNGDEWYNSTNWLSDAPICDWYGIDCNNDDNMFWINLYYNNLQGSIPSELGLLTNLESLRLPFNSLTGSIPSELGLLPNLERLSLPYNSLTGSIPSEMGLLTNLEDLWLDDNLLTGSIPSELGLLSNLERLILYDNSLTGSIPSEMGLLINLRYLYLDDNSLTGSIPSELGLLVTLERFYLYHNSLTGTLPDEVCALRDDNGGNLRILYADCAEVTCPCCTYCF